MTVIENDPVYLAPIGAATAMFTFVSQCFRTSYALDLLLFFCRSFRLPMLIFTLDPDGIIRLLTVKPVGAVVCGLLSVFLFFIGLCVSLAVGVVTFPFCLAREIENLKGLRPTP